MLHRNNYVTFKKGIDFFSFCYKSFILLIQHFQVILQLLFLLPHRKAFTPATLCYFGVEFFFYYNSIFAMFFYYDTRTVQNKHFFSDFLGSMFYIFYIIYLQDVFATITALPKLYVNSLFLELLHVLFIWKKTVRQQFYMYMFVF